MPQNDCGSERDSHFFVVILFGSKHPPPPQLSLFLKFNKKQKAKLVSNMRNKGTIFVKIFDDMIFWQLFKQIYVFARIFAVICGVQEKLRAAELKNLLELQKF